MCIIVISFIDCPKVMMTQYGFSVNEDEIFQENTSIINHDKMNCQTNDECIGWNQHDSEHLSSYSKTSNKMQKELATDVDLIIKYFDFWKNHTQHVKLAASNLHSKENKFINFMENLAEYKKHTSAKVAKETIINDNNKGMKTTGDCYQNRFKAQKNIIKLQKQKLLLQERLIQNLKLDHINTDLEKSLKETQDQLRDLFIRSSAHTKCTVKPVNFKLTTANSLLDFELKSDKVPTIMQKMEARAVERSQKRQLILERKKMLQEQDRLARESEIKRKEALKKEERVKQLEVMKVERRKQFQLQKQKIALQKKYEQLNSLADCHYKHRLLVHSFRKWHQLWLTVEETIYQCEHIYENGLKTKCFRKLLQHAEDANHIKFLEADQLYAHKLKKKAFTALFEVYYEYVQKHQVAQDFYSLQMGTKILQHWNSYTYAQHVRREKTVLRMRAQIAKRSMLHHFYLWRTLPAANQLEKVKEEKKRKWREKVYEIIPNYQPQGLEYIYHKIHNI